jgi:cation:H+ antiporter
MDLGIFLEIILLILGFVFLIKGSDIFVDGASSIASILKIPTIIVGLTIVALGTSAPEAAVSITSSLTGSNAMAVSNVIGSNMFNLLMIIGICALIKELPLEKEVLKRDLPILLIITIAFSLLAYLLKGVWNYVGILLLVALCAYIFKLVRDVGNTGVTNYVEEPKFTLKSSIIHIIIGSILIVVGGNWVVHSASEIAMTLGMSETLVGLTIVAIGTSLPELVTSVTALRKGETELVIGNVIGSNIFNILFVLGASSAISSIPLDGSIFADLLFMAICTLIFFIFGETNLLTKNKDYFDKPEGAILIILFIIYMGFAIWRNYFAF